MNEIQRLHRINDRKFTAEEFAKNYMGDEIMEVKEKDRIKKILKDADIPANEHDITWIHHAVDDLNLYMKMDILDGRSRNIHRINRDDSAKLYVRAVPMEHGTHKISIEYLDDSDDIRSALTDFGNDKLSYLNQLIYDIYSGCPRFEWDTDLEAHIKNSISIINAARDGVTYRRDIFTCKTYGTTFVPIDIINLKVEIDKKIKDKPFVTGLLYLNNGKKVKPYAIETSLGEVSKQYENEAIMVPGERISLASMNNLFIQLINDSKHADVLRLAMAKLVKAKMRNMGIDSDINDALDIFRDNALFVDDNVRDADKGPELPKVI